MKRLVCLVLLLIVTCVFGEEFSGFRNETDMARLTGSTAVTSTETNYKFLCTVYDTTGAALTGNKQKFGPCVIVHKKWVIAHSDLHSAVTDANIGKLRVSTLTTAGYTQPATAITSRVQKRVVQGANPQSLEYLNKIQLFKVCPSLPSDRIFDPPNTPVNKNFDDPYEYFNFDATTENLMSASKTIADNCECDEYIPPGGDIITYKSVIEPKTFCGKQIVGKEIEPTDKVGTVAVITTPAGKYLYAGFLLANDKGGDLYLDISAYLFYIMPQIL